MRIMRTAATLAVLLLASLPLRATETPLVIYGGGIGGIIEPGTGTITLFEVTGQILNRYGSANFLTDLRALRDRPYDERGGVTYTMLQVGAGNFLPTPAEVLSVLPDTQTPEEKANNIGSFRNRAIKAEADFWAKPLEYDGVVRGAFSKDALFLGIPSMHALLVYEITDRNKGPVFKSWRNVGPDLLIPQVWKSIPTPQEIYNQLPEEDRKLREKELQEAFKKAGDKAGALTLQACDWWITSAGDRFMLVDFANKHLVTYLYNGNKVSLAGVRNIEIDQIIPTGMSTKPTPNQTIVAFQGAHRKELQDFQFVLDRDNLAALISQNNTTNAGKVSPIQAVASGGDVILNFTELHKVFVYRILGQGNNLELVAVRDNTVDIGLDLLANLMSAQVRGAESYQGAIRLLAQRMESAAMMMLKYALKEAPALGAKAEKDQKLEGLRKHADWQAVIDDAKKRATEEEEKRKERARLVEEMKKKRQGP